MITKPTNYLFMATWLAVLFIFLSSFSNPQLNSISLKSLFIYNFTKHVDWPENGTTNITIGIVSEPMLIEKLGQVLKNKKIKEKPYDVVSIQSPEDALQCQLIFIPAHQGYRIKQFIKSLEGKAVLIVTEGAGMVAKGAAISIIEENNKLTFEVNEQAILKSGLGVSNELLRLGSPVNKK